MVFQRAEGDCLLVFPVLGRRIREESKAFERECVEREGKRKMGGINKRDSLTQTKR